MAKTLANYDPLVQIPSGMTPAGADFPIVESHDILVGENDKRLDAKLDDIDSAIGNVGQTPIATQLSSKVNTGDIVTSVAATGSTSNNKIPSETAVRAAIEAKTINVDSTVTQGSTNAVSGGAVHTQLATKQDVLTFDTTPTASSSNPVTSGGVKSALDTKQDALTFDTTPTASSSNPVTSGGVKAALDTKQNTLTYETTPIVGSVNPVTSTGIRNAIDAAAAGNLGQMQLQYDEFVSDAEDVLEQAKSLSNGMVACSNIAAETTVGDTRILLYTGTTNSRYTNGHWYYNSAASNAAPSWTDGGAVGSAPTIDNTLAIDGAAANSKSVGDAIENIVTISNTQPGSNSGNKVWIKETTSEEVQVPTYAEHIAKANKADIATNNESDNGSGTISASKAYAIGDHFYINNTNTSSENYGVSTLYKATAAIASGAAIVVGTNCEASKVADEITSLSNDIDTVKADLDNKIDADGEHQVKPNNIDGVTVSGGNILDDAERIYSTQQNASTTDGYVAILQNGKAIIQTTGSYASFLIAVKPNTHYTANNFIRFAVLLKNLIVEEGVPVKYTTVVGSALANIYSFDTGEADHIIVSFNYNTYPIDSFIISEGDTPTADKTITLPDWWTDGSTPTVVEKPKFATVTGNMVSGGDLQLPSARSNLRKGERIVFEGNITNFSTLTIGLTRFTYDFGNDANSRNIFVIDGTNITYKAYPTATAVAVPHGLTISGNIQIIWEMTATASCKITLISNGVLFSHEFTNFVRQVIGNPFVYSANSELTGCKLTWTCTDIDKKIWMFGDSYFGYLNVRWTYYLHQYGYDNNCLLDGFPGQGGVNGRVAFNNLLQFGTPKYAVWCLGMNDKTDSDSAPASNWVSARDVFLQYCTLNNVTPIFGTIPTVPTINHEQKNAWIRSSGYRYIDFAKAVGASANGVWYGDMLSSDGVHPSESGARALFAQVLIDLPEIMLDD